MSDFWIYFNIGLKHVLSLFLSVFNVVRVNENLVEFLIPITILIAAVYNIIATGKSFKKNNITFIAFITLFFGIIHGLGFSNYFNSILSGKPSDKLAPLLEFSLGIEVAQLAVVISALILAYVVQTILRFSKRDWILIVSSFIIGVILPMILESEIWK